MNLNNLYYFTIVAQYEHYTKAAEYLCITQPSLSRAIASLEDELGIPLFEKDGRNIRLTKYGILLNSYVSKSYQEIEFGYSLLQDMKRKEFGVIDFSFLFVLGYNFVPLLIKNFLAIEGNKGIRINFNQCNTATSLDKIKEGSVDIGLCTYMPDEPDIDFTPVLKQNLVCITSANHPLAQKKSVSMEELLPYPLIKYTESAGEIQSFIDRLFAECKGEPTHFCTMAEEITMAGLVSTNHNNCIAIVPDLDILNNFSVKKIPLHHSEAYRTIYLATAKSRSLLPSGANFFHYILEYASNVYKVER